jgi:putative transposase
MYLSYDAPSANTVLMILRDYVRRNGRLPDTIVLDNGAEFHSAALKRFCDLFRVNIRWRRRSKPRDSTLVERMLGVTETEVIAAQDGNTRCLKNPRMVSAEVHPGNFIRWTLPALHGSIEHFLFEIHPARVHPRFGVSPNDRESRLVVELGSREHVIVRYDEYFRLLTSPHSGSKPMRVVDRQRGVFVDGMHYWHECLSKAKPKEEVEVRVEMWCARVVYVCFRNDWVIAQARDGGRLDGRFRHEYEIAKRTENRERRTRAQQARRSSAGSHRKQELWIPERWDPRLREQAVEAYHLYSRLGMTEAFAGARSTRAGELALAGTAVASAPKQEPAAGTTSTQQVARVPAKAPKPADATSTEPTARGADVPEAKSYSYF